MDRDNIFADALSSALDCCRLLLQLVKDEVQKTPSLSSHSKLKSAIKEYGKAHDVDMALCRLKFHKLTPKQLPLAFRDKQGKFVVLVRLSSNQALIQSPYAASPEILPIDELEARWNGEVIQLRGASHRFDISWFIPAFVHHRHLIGEVLVFSLMLQLLALVTPLFFQVVMDKVLVHRALSTLDVLVIALVVVGMFEVVLRGLREYLFAHTANRIDITLGVKLFRYLLGLPLLYFKHRQVGSIITRVREMGQIQQFLTGSALTMVLDLAFVGLFVAVMFSYAPKLTWLVLVSLVLYFLFWMVVGPVLRARVLREYELRADNTAFLIESVTGIETIKTSATEAGFLHRWKHLLSAFVRASFRAKMVEQGSHEQLLALDGL
ncbi:hypothetical protein H8A87_13345 [Xenorhabdus sp. VLS]|uniref:Type I secretion system permease/ATPase n=1 Tax=Xenorhabdus lircayensis TaxID=2763499 RepID=A0ABS0UAF1_9GAMM|nr:hypothetical protein [Xenorhabdus lircayensis]